MDPINHAPPMTTYPADHAAGIPPPQPMPVNHALPPYADMIYAAITALKDRDGSSRQAISKYIEKEYPNLPPTHATMLTHHLKRLKNQGQLVMVKHSYMLPSMLASRSVQFQPPTTTAYHPTLDFGANLNVNATDANVNENVNVNAATGGVDLGNSPTSLSKRKPGRPPKLRPVPGPGVQGQMPNVQVYEGDAPSYQPQFQYQVGVGQDLQVDYGSVSGFQGNSAGGSEPLFASLGLGDDAVVVPVPSPPVTSQPLVTSPPPTENTSSVVKRGRGRPPKAASSGGGVAGSGGSNGGVGEGEGQGVESGSEVPLRKPKMVSVMAVNGGRIKRGRGRPKRLGLGAVTVPLSGSSLRPRGRPKRGSRPNVGVNGGVDESVMGSRRSGRPRGRPSVNKIAKYAGGPVGRPSKVGPGTAVLVTDPRQLVVYQELKNKYELLQSKVKQVASVVKPCIDPEGDYGSTVLGALQELEALAGGDTNGAPPPVQTHEPAPAPFPQS